VLNSEAFHISFGHVALRPVISGNEPSVTYPYSRLCFIKKRIDPLSPDDQFRIVTPVGTFQMSKREFETDFAEVAFGDCYNVKVRRYHYRKLPSKAEKYRI